MKNPFNSWGFVDDDTLIYEENVSKDEVEEMVEQALDGFDVKIEGHDLLYKLLVNGVVNGEIDIPKDQFLKNVSYNTETKKLVFVMETTTGEVTTEVDIEDLVAGLEVDVEDIEQQLTTFATTDSVNTVIAQKDEQIQALSDELYSLKKIVGDIGGNVVYNFPESGKTLTTLLGNNGTVKVTEDYVTDKRYGPGVMASNHTTLNFGTHNLEMNVAGDYASILVRGTQEITIQGSSNGRFANMAGGVLVWNSSANAVVNIKGASTTVFENNRPGAECVYCQAGTINISGGIFKNNGSRYLLNCYDANYQAGTAKIIVTGGKFYDFDPGNNTAEGENTSFLAEGYISVASTEIIDGVEHTVYTVKKAS